jgi:hypothetical protein
MGKERGLISGEASIAPTRSEVVGGNVRAAAESGVSREEPILAVGSTKIRVGVIVVIDAGPEE